MPYLTSLKQRSRNLRQESTCAEQLLWEALRGRKILGYKFTRQKPILGYIADFYCAELLLIIEVDGLSHTKQTQEYDEMRTMELQVNGFTVKRYLNEEIEQALPSVIENIIEHIQTHTASRVSLP
jgi:very-short-patch-repair endonuclease